MLGLSGKYAVTLYEILESVVNMKNPVLEADLTTLRRWLKIADGKLDRYVDLKRRAIEPAIQQINDNPEVAGFSVEMEPIKRSHAVDRIRFTIKKTSFLAELETKLQRDQSMSTSSKPTTFKTAIYEQAKKAAPTLDIYYLETEWYEWIAKNKTATTNPEGSFISFCKRWYKNAVQ